MENPLMENDIKKCKKEPNRAEKNRELASLISTKIKKSNNPNQF